MKEREKGEVSIHAFDTVHMEEILRLRFENLQRGGEGERRKWKWRSHVLNRGFCQFSLIVNWMNATLRNRPASNLMEVTYLIYSVVDLSIFVC